MTIFLSGIKRDVHELVNRQRPCGRKIAGNTLWPLKTRKKNTIPKLGVFSSVLLNFILMPVDYYHSYHGKEKIDFTEADR